VKVRIAEQRARTIRERMTADIDKRMASVVNLAVRRVLVEQVVDDAMFHVEHLLEELDDWRDEHGT
jgi:hypothetical protein